MITYQISKDEKMMQACGNLRVLPRNLKYLCFVNPTRRNNPMNNIVASCYRYTMNLEALFCVLYEI
jgi:hypothetical protein